MSLVLLTAEILTNMSNKAHTVTHMFNFKNIKTDRKTREHKLSTQILLPQYPPTDCLNSELLKRTKTIAFRTIENNQK